jgi:hypothetical protein
MNASKFDVVLALLACILMMFLSVQSLASAFSLPALYWLLNGAFGLYLLVRDVGKYGIAV